MKKLIIVTLSFALLAAGAEAQRSKSKGRTAPYFQQQGSVTLNAGFFYLNSPRSVTSPKVFTPEVTVINNLTAGVSILHYQYRMTYADTAFESATQWISEDIKFNHLLVALRLNYYLNDFLNDNLPLNLNPRKYGVYASLLAGTNLVMSNSSDAVAKAIIEDDKGFRFGVLLGGRYMHSNRLSFFVEAGYADPYGITSFGAAYKLLP